MSHPPARVASLLPSATEHVCLLGAADRLVATSHECDFPPEIVGRPALTRARIALDGGSRSIDDEVRGVVAQALSVYEVDADALERLAPELVVTQDLCEVCAVSLGDVEDAVRRLSGATVLSLSPTRLEDVFEDLLRVGDALGLRERAERELTKLRLRVAEVAERAAALPARPRVLTIEWIDPVMVGGTWMPELVALAGGGPLVTKAGDHAPTLDREALAALDPEVVLMKPCGFPIDRTLQEQDVLRRQFDGLGWTALRENAVWIADGNAFFNRPGPRLVESLEILAACTHPDAFGDLAERHAESFRRWNG